MIADERLAQVGEVGVVEQWRWVGGGVDEGTRESLNWDPVGE